MPLLLPPASHDEPFIRTLPSPAPPLDRFLFLCTALFSFPFAVSGTDTRYCLVLLLFLSVVPVLLILGIWTLLSLASIASLVSVIYRYHILSP